MNLRAWLGSTDDETLIPNFVPRQPYLRRQPVRFRQSRINRFSRQYKALTNIANEHTRRQDDIKPEMA